MIILLHDIDSQLDQAFVNGEKIDLQSVSTFDHMKELAQKYPQEWIGWSDKKSEAAEWEELKAKAPTKFTAVSKGKPPTFLEGIGYVEDSPFINFKPNQFYPTWLMSSDQGIIHASVINLENEYQPLGLWEYDLNVLTRILQPKGLFCYSNLDTTTADKKHSALLYQFVAQTKKKQWIFFLLLCHIIYEKRFSFYALAKAIFKSRLDLRVDFSSLQKTLSTADEKEDYDVIIPTMGRVEYLKDVLHDLAAQTLKPRQVIIVEQNEDTDATSDLGYLKSEQWPFQLSHDFIHQTGACNARNRAIDKTMSPWVLFFDDDIRVESNFFNRVIINLVESKAKALTFACLQKGESEDQKDYLQWAFFGSGCSIVHRDVIDKCEFDMALEHGYGEDVDYGMQIRNAGYDIIYAPQIQILHLKAPVGGFRKPQIFPWTEDSVQPKPSPFIMYFRQKNFSQLQLKGYKMVQLFKTYRKLGTRNPLKHFSIFSKQWEQSQFYASKLMKAQ